jgi:hypothetical protein
VLGDATGRDQPMDRRKSGDGDVICGDGPPLNLFLGFLD